LLKGDKVLLRQKRVSDADNDYTWRCDPDLTVLDAAPPLRLSRREYVAFSTDEMRYPHTYRRRFAIDSADGEHIGNCMYFDIDDTSQQAEIGVMIGNREYWDRGYGTDAVRTLVRHIFGTTRIDRVYLKTLEWNLRAQRCFGKCGFVKCGRASKNGHDFIIMELHRRWFESQEAGESAGSQATIPDQSA